MADAMEVPATDMPRAEYEKRIKDAGATNGHPTTDFMVLGALSGDPTMFLLGAFGPKSIASYIHYAAWVPESMAKDPQDAIHVAEATMVKALINSTEDETSRKQISESGMRDTMGIPFGEGGPIHATVQLKQLVGGFTPKLGPAPSFMNTTEKVYGPIFVRPNTWYTDAKGAQWVAKLTETLPDWFYVYDPGFPGISPRMIHHQKETLLFIAPN